MKKSAPRKKVTRAPKDQSMDIFKKHTHLKLLLVIFVCCLVAFFILNSINS